MRPWYPNNLEIPSSTPRKEFPLKVNDPHASAHSSSNPHDCAQQKGRNAGLSPTAVRKPLTISPKVIASDDSSRVESGGDSLHGEKRLSPGRSRMNNGMSITTKRSGICTSKAVWNPESFRTRLNPKTAKRCTYTLCNKHETVCKGQFLVSKSIKYQTSELTSCNAAKMLARSRRRVPKFSNLQQGRPQEGKQPW